MKYLVEAGADPNVMNSWNHPPAAIALLKQHFGIATYLLQLPNINAKFADEEGRNLAIQLIMNFSTETFEQLKFIGDKTNVDFGSLDKNGMSVYHYLAMTEPVKKLEEDNKAQEMEDVEDLSEEKAEEEKESIADAKSEEKSAEDESEKNSQESKSENEDAEKKDKENMESESGKDDDFKPLADTELTKNKNRNKNNDSEDSESDNDDAEEMEKEENNMSEEEKMAKLRKAHNKLLITCAEYIKSKNSTDINAPTELGTTALLLAIENEYYDYALWLLENGSSIEGKVASRDNLIHLLINNMDKKGNIQILKAVMKKFDELSTSWKKLAIQANENGEAPIHLLALSIMSSNANIKSMAMELFKFLIEVTKK